MLRNNYLSTGNVRSYFYPELYCNGMKQMITLWLAGSYILLLVAITMWHAGKEFAVQGDALYSFRKSTEAYYNVEISLCETRDYVREVATDKSEQSRAAIFQKIHDSIRSMDSCHRQLVGFIEEIKRNLIRFATGADDKRMVLQSDSYRLYDMKGWQLHRNYYTEVEQLALHPSASYPAGFAKELLKKLREYRRRLLEVSASHYTWTMKELRPESRNYYLKPPECRFYRKQSDLDIILMRAMKKCNVSLDDEDVLKHIFSELQFNQPGESEQAFLQRVFGHCSLAGCLERLTAIETDITEPLLMTWKSWTAIGCFSDCLFYRPEAVVDLPQDITKGQPFEYSVRVGGFSDEKRFMVQEAHSVNQKQISGGAILRTSIQGDSTVLHGTYTVFNLSGIPKTLHWERKVKVTR